MTECVGNMCLHEWWLRLVQQYVPNVAVLLAQMTALPDRDVVFVRFQNEGSSHSCLPYFIAIDEHSKSVGQFST